MACQILRKPLYIWNTFILCCQFCHSDGNIEGYFPAQGWTGTLFYLTSPLKALLLLVEVLFEQFSLWGSRLGCIFCINIKDSVKIPLILAKNAKTFELSNLILIFIKWNFVWLWWKIVLLQFYKENYLYWGHSWLKIFCSFHFCQNLQHLEPPTSVSASFSDPQEMDGYSMLVGCVQ